MANIKINDDIDWYVKKLLKKYGVKKYDDKIVEVLNRAYSDGFEDGAEFGDTEK